MSAALAGTEICVFDAYGTLYDFNSAVARHRSAIGPKADALSEMWRTKQIQYTWLRNSMAAYAPFWQVTGEALDNCLATHGITDPSVREKLMSAYLALDPFPEVPAMLDRLKRAGGRLAVPSNRHPGIVDPRTYKLVGARFGVAPDKVCFLSSNCWDAHGAAHFGFRTVWVNRGGLPEDNLPGKVVTQVKDLSHLPALIGVA